MCRLLVAALLWALLPAAHAADLGVMPVAVQLDRERDRASVQVTNNGNQPVVLQAEAIAWNREGGVDADGPTSDLIVNPPVFTVKPGQTQIVRLGLRKTSTSDKETTYRMVLREVPVPLGPEQSALSGQVRVLVALRLPVFVAPRVVVRDERWQARRESDGSVTASVTNAGNVHYKVATVKLRAGHNGADDTSVPMAERSIGRVVFPGEAFSLRLPAGTTRTAQMTLEVMTDRGPHYVPLDVAAR